MPPSLPILVALFAAPAATLPTEFLQIAPDAAGKPWWVAGEKHKDRAVLLIPGLKLHPLRPGRTTRPELHDWQEPKCELVKALSRDADVFAFGYGQTAPLDVVPHTPGLRDAVAQLRKAGYQEIVLVGHSAGAVIARLFVENYPDAGVTKLIQVAAPNNGSELASVFKTGYPKSQAAFIQSLAPPVRAEANRTAKRPLGPKVEAVCVVCKLPRIDGDGLVPLASQWPEELQAQGVPAALVVASHFEAMRSAAGVRVVSELAREKLTRWAPEQLDTARRVLFRDPEEAKK